MVDDYDLPLYPQHGRASIRRPQFAHSMSDTDAFSCRLRVGHISSSLGRYRKTLRKFRLRRSVSCEDVSDRWSCSLSGKLESQDSVMREHITLEVSDISTCHHAFEVLEHELRKKDLELERCKLQLEQQAHQLQAQRDEMSEIKLIMEDTDKRLAYLTIKPPLPENRIKFEDGRPEDQGAWYWIFHKYQSGIVNAFKASLVELAHQFAREKVISPTMEKYVVEEDTVTSERRADELMKAVQFALNGNPQNFRKVVNVLRMSDNPLCKRLSDRLADECHLSNGEEHIT